MFGALSSTLVRLNMLSGRPITCPQVPIAGSSPRSRLRLDGIALPATQPCIVAAPYAATQSRHITSGTPDTPDALPQAAT